jgi:hypothetical protein
MRNGRLTIHGFDDQIFPFEQTYGTPENISDALVSVEVASLNRMQ